MSNSEEIEKVCKELDPLLLRKRCQAAISLQARCPEAGDRESKAFSDRGNPIWVCKVHDIVLNAYYFMEEYV